MFLVESHPNSVVPRGWSDKCCVPGNGYPIRGHGIRQPPDNFVINVPDYSTAQRGGSIMQANEVFVCNCIATREASSHPNSSEEACAFSCFELKPLCHSIDDSICGAG